MKTLIAIAISLHTFSALALCGNDQLVFEVILNEFTSNKAFLDGQSPLVEGDFVRVFEIATKKTIYLKSGTFSDDGGGNFAVEATNPEGHQIRLSHDHETWDQGMWGHYKSQDGTAINLSNVICSYDDLFLVR